MNNNNIHQMHSIYAEMDPSHRYGRFKDVLGKGAMKNVYRAFDEFLGMEVAWNQVKLNDIFGSPDELQRLYSEVHLLKTLNHNSIMRSHASWIDTHRTTFNFITEMFTSGTLREYRKKYTRVNTRVIKNWARQILEGLDYLHRHNPPVIHRDLKCDNIFVNGHLGQLKIGDLGLAAILRGSHHAHSVIGTPEFMAPELYDEDYDELVDIYSFGMCVLEMLTCEYPYNECSNPAQIYKKVTSGKLPQTFFKIDDAEARRFVGRCLDKATNRPSARELLEDPFLSIEEVDEFPTITIPCQKISQGGRTKGLMTHLVLPTSRTEMIIKGTMNSEDDTDTIFLQVQLSDKYGHPRNIYFPFDIGNDTALDVAAEMVKELEISDWEPCEIAEMIDNEVSGLIPSRKNPYSPQINQQHSFNYFDGDDDDDNADDSPHHPFYPTSSVSSSQASLGGVFSLDDAQLNQGDTVHDWIQEDLNAQDDASSDCSSLSPKYSSLKYFSENEDVHLSSSLKDDLQYVSRTQKSTRFCPDRDLDGRSKHQQKMVQTKSMMDIRSQLLHRTLVEEISKRRQFNTVGSLEHIGYHEPGDVSVSKTMSGVCLRQSASWNKF